jgi:hypothetical protein
MRKRMVAAVRLTALSLGASFAFGTLVYAAARLLELGGAGVGWPAGHYVSGASALELRNDGSCERWATEWILDGSAQRSSKHSVESGLWRASGSELVFSWSDGSKERASWMVGAGGLKHLEFSRSASAYHQVPPFECFGY